MTTPTTKSSVGLVGMAVMGQNLALNIARSGFSIAVYNRTTKATTDFVARSVTDEPLVGCTTLEEFVAQLERPRKIILLVKAGSPVDSTIESLLPHLEPGDLIIDAGNSHPADTTRRARDLPERGVRFMGMGVSGGEEGALLGPSLMPGGPAEAYRELEPMLKAIAAQVDDGPCVTHLGPGAAGHFVKMVHNGIEYGDMQLIAEGYDLLKHAAGLSNDELAETFSRWNGGELDSFLIEITADIFGTDDPDTDHRLIDVVLDRAGQKGTGRWTAEIALEQGIAIPTIAAAVDARILSSRLDDRKHIAPSLTGPDATPSDRSLVDDIEHALYASKICSYAQGLDLLRAASDTNDWDLDLGDIARIWKGGCIIRAKLLSRIQGAYSSTAGLRNLLLDSELGGYVQTHQSAWRRVVAAAAIRGIPTLAMGASLSYFDSIRRERLPQNLTQAQRDYFGAHTFERVDRPRDEWFHHDWIQSGTVVDPSA